MKKAAFDRLFLLPDHVVMLSRPDRLRRMRDFALLSQKGRPVFLPFFTLRFRQSQTKTKVGFVASAKVFKLAVDRNRVKRRLREALFLVKSDWPKSMDLLFVAKPEAQTIAFQDLVKAVKRSFERIPEALTQPVKPKKMKARRPSSVIYKPNA